MKTSILGTGWLEEHTDKGNLHGKNESENKEGCVSSVDAVGIAPHQDEHKHMQRYEIDDINVSTPSWDLQKMQH